MILLGAIVAVLGVLTGLWWRTLPGAAADTCGFERLNRPERIPILDPLWAGVRPIGRTWFLILVAGSALALGGLPWGSFAIAGAALGLLEPALKRIVRRPRPFLTLPGALVRLARRPTDESFPSGDAGRAGLLAAFVCFAASAPAWAGALAAGAAAFVAVGRVRAGVHYPLDVWAGAWLGFGIGMLWAGMLPVLVG